MSLFSSILNSIPVPLVKALSLSISAILTSFVEHEEGTQSAQLTHKNSI